MNSGIVKRLTNICWSTNLRHRRFVSFMCASIDFGFHRRNRKRRSFAGLSRLLRRRRTARNDGVVHAHLPLDDVVHPVAPGMLPPQPPGFQLHLAEAREAAVGRRQRQARAELDGPRFRRLAGELQVRVVLHGVAVAVLAVDVLRHWHLRPDDGVQRAQFLLRPAEEVVVLVSRHRHADLVRERHAVIGETRKEERQSALRTPVVERRRLAALRRLCRRFLGQFRRRFVVAERIVLRADAVTARHSFRRRRRAEVEPVTSRR